MAVEIPDLVVRGSLELQIGIAAAILADADQVGHFSGIQARQLLSERVEDAQLIDHPLEVRLEVRVLQAWKFQLHTGEDNLGLPRSFEYPPQKAQPVVRPMHLTADQPLADLDRTWIQQIAADFGKTVCLDDPRLSFRIEFGGIHPYQLAFRDDPPGRGCTGCFGSGFHGVLTQLERFLF